jgi:hypothetical protein
LRAAARPHSAAKWPLQSYSQVINTQRKIEDTLDAGFPMVS